MLTPALSPYRRRSGRAKKVFAPSRPGAALILVTAYYDENVPLLYLGFDRAVNIAAFNGAAITLVDGSFDNFIYNGVGPVDFVDPKTLQVPLVITGPYGVDEVKLSANGSTGIVAVNDRGIWPGVMNLFLPFP